MKTKTLYVCQECGAQSSGWLGKCPSCQSWNSFVEERMNPIETPRGEMFSKQNPVLLSEILIQDENRFETGNQEFDRVLGGGVVPGSVTLLGGDPGIGKSTLALQAACLLSAKGQKVFMLVAKNL